MLSPDSPASCYSCPAFLRFALPLPFALVTCLAHRPRDFVQVTQASGLGAELDADVQMSPMDGMEGMKTPASMRTASNAGKWMAITHHLLGDTSCSLQGKP